MYSSVWTKWNSLRAWAGRKALLGLMMVTVCTAGPVWAQPQPDCNTNGVPDAMDIAGVGSDDCNNNAVPDECDLQVAEVGGTSADCNGDGVPDECQLAGNDCNANGVQDECDLAGAPADDCDTNSVLDVCELASGDCDADGILDLCEYTDCNANATFDGCEIAEGDSQDCNANDYPDECDLLGGTSADCNANSQLDECESAIGASDDCNSDGVPDECQFVDCAPTPAEPNVVVNLNGGIEAPGGTRVTFAHVTEAGSTRVVNSNSGPVVPAFVLGSPDTYYDVATTAQFDGTVTVCFNYADVSYDYGESALQLRHYEGRGVGACHHDVSRSGRGHHLRSG